MPKDTIESLIAEVDQVENNWVEVAATVIRFCRGEKS